MSQPVARRRPVLTALLAVAVALGSAAPSAAQTPGEPTPGAADLGDRLFPGLGNGGYDVQRYRLDLRYATSDPAQAIAGTATITARATQALSRFNLDWAGQGVGAVTVDGATATWVQEGEELVVTPARPLAEGTRFRVRVADFTAAPTAVVADDPASKAFFITPHGSATALQPNYAHRVFPSNDHPRDKARFSINLDVPAGTVAVASGVRLGRRIEGERAVWSYLQRQPMATQLVQLAVGSWDVIERGERDGVQVRDVVAPSLRADLEPKLALELGHLDWMRGRLGAYPFDVYGSLVVDAELGFALETQTLSIYYPGWFTAPQGLWDPVMLHELAHQWFGDSVALHEWSDLWLSEGHASWYEFLYAEEKGFLVEDTTGYPNETGSADFDDYMQAIYALGDRWRARWGPVAQPVSAEELFSLNVYPGGALVLYALREEIGVEAFERLEREWVTRYEGRSASTADWIALASEIAGRDLTAFLRAWLYDATTPPMPGHPDWTVLPVEAPEPAAQPLRTGPLLRR